MLFPTLCVGLTLVVFLFATLTWCDLAHDQRVNAKISAERTALVGGTAQPVLQRVTPLPAVTVWRPTGLCGCRLQYTTSLLDAETALVQHAQTCRLPRPQLVTYDCCDLFTWQPARA